MLVIIRAAKLFVRGKSMELTAENIKGEKTKYRLAKSMKECMKTTAREFDTLKSKKVPQSLEIGLFFCQIFIFII